MVRPKILLYSIRAIYEGILYRLEIDNNSGSARLSRLGVNPRIKVYQFKKMPRVGYPKPSGDLLVSLIKDFDND